MKTWFSGFALQMHFFCLFSHFLSSKTQEPQLSKRPSLHNLLHNFSEGSKRLMLWFIRHDARTNNGRSRQIKEENE